MGLAPALNIPSSSVPPSGAMGGNIDDRRMGAGASMYYPVQVAGGLLSFGDTHAGEALQRCQVGSCAGEHRGKTDMGGQAGTQQLHACLGG